MIRIAHFSPLPPQPSGIADHCATLLPYLAEQMEVDAFAEGPFALGKRLESVQIRPLEEFEARSELRRTYDVCVYHMGNHPAYHQRIYAMLLCWPGIAVLHEVDLHSFHLQRAGRVAYVREMAYAYGVEGAREARQVCAGLGNAPSSRLLSKRIVDVSLGAIVHTNYARRVVLAESPSARVGCVPLAVGETESASARKPVRWPLPLDSIVLASFGIIAPSKRVESVLRALVRLNTKDSNWRYVWVGEPAPSYNPMPLIRDLGLTDRVQVTGYVDGAEFEAWLHAVDIGLNLRSAPTGGEMSAALGRLMAHGRPVLVSDVGGFSDLPDDCVVKIRQDETEVEQVVTALRRLIADPSARAAYGEAARRYVQREWSFPRVARDYASFIQSCLDAIVAPSQEHA
jgi:glycosyltransferase involved in cell wall biosynthesis